MRSYLVTRISLPEGTALLQLRGVQGSPEEVSLVWQRCAGHVFALVLFGALVKLSGISLSYLLTSPDYQPFWAGEVTSHLITSVYHYLNPIQYALMRALSLFRAPVPLQGIVMTATGSSNSSETDNAMALERELGVLTQLSLVQVSPNPDGSLCYSMHPLLRQYAQEHYLERLRSP